VIHPGVPRLPAADAEGRLLWREEWSRRGVAERTAWWFLLFIMFIGFFILSRNILSQSLLEPYLDKSGALLVWVTVSVVLTALAAVLLAFIARKFRGARLKNEKR